MNLVRLYLKQEDQKITREENLRWKNEGDHIIYWREKAGLSKAFVSRLTGIGYRRLSRFEKGLPTRGAYFIYSFLQILFYEIYYHSDSISDNNLIEYLHEELLIEFGY